MHRFFLNTGVFLALLASAVPVLGMEVIEEDHSAASITPVISGPSDIAVGRTLVLDASASAGVDETAEYRWFREGVTQPISRTLEAVYTPEQPGRTVIRLVISMTIDGEEVTAEAVHEVIVYQRKIVLIADATVAAEKLLVHQQEAERGGTYLRIIRPTENTIPIGDDSLLTRVIKESNGALAGAEAIVIWSDGISGLQALQRAVEGDADRMNELPRQTIMLITERSLNTLARTARGPFSVLDPSRIIITRKEAMSALLTAENVDQFLERLTQWDFDFQIVDESTAALRPWNVLSSLVNYMLTHGVSTRTAILLLILPLIATILAFLKQVIGVTTFGLYTPSVIALSFLALGWQIGVAFLLFILVTGYATRSLMRGWRLLYVPKVAIILTVVSLTLLLLLGLGAYFGLTLSGDTIFILLIMSTLSETFLNVKTEEGLWSAVMGVGETVIASLLCVFIVQWPALQSFILAYPETILVTLLVNIVLGKWAGLRLVEYFRFREVFRHLQEE
jgi:hypothetical protein